MENLSHIGRKILYAGSHKNDNQRKLIIILTAFGFLLTLFEAFIAVELKNQLLLYGFAGVLLLACLCAYKNILFIGSVVAPLIAFAMVTIFVYDNGIHDEAIASYYLLLIIAGLLLGDIGSIIFGTLSTIAIALIGFAQYNNMLPHHHQLIPLTDHNEIITSALLMLSTTLVLQYLVSRLHREATNAHESEQAQLTANESLRQLQAELEQRVENRTAELQMANQEMSKQLEEIKDLRIKLQEEAIRDPLTGLFNRRYLKETLVREFAHARREDYDISFMLLDIDHFKKFNDLYGHATGDLAIKTVAKQLISRARAGGIACRMGGEEFLLVMPGILDEVAQLRAEYFRDQVMALPIPYGDQSLSLTVSIGIASFPKNGETWEELYEAVDQALYRAKQNGRNRVECA